MRQFNKFKDTKGFIRTWEYVVRFRYMITKEAQRRVKVLAFWEQYGDRATQDAFAVSRATLYRWQARLRRKGGAVQALNKQSTAPRHRRKRVVSPTVEEFIIKERQREKIGKVKLAKLLKDDSIADLHPSTVGRILADLKQQGKLPNLVKLSFYARSGTFKERAYRPCKKLRSKSHEGGLVKADTIVRFTNGIKRYVVTALDRESKFGFAYAYTSHSSRKTADFMATFKQVAPISLTHVQTDNGSEFQHHFELLLKREGIVHFHSYPRCPQMQSEVERFNRTLSEAFIQKNRHLLAYNLEEFNKQLIDWLLWYNTRRPHWSLELKSPLRYICDKLTKRQSHMCWTSTFDCSISQKTLK